MTPTPNPDVAAGVTAFNTDQWADAFLAFQTHWLAVRTPEAKALAQYANAVNQLHLGLLDAPKTALTRVLALTDGIQPRTGVDIAALRRDAQRLLAALPEDAADPMLVLPIVRLEWTA